MSKKVKGKQIADYVWLDKTQRSWHIWSGNPFCISLYTVPLKEMTEGEIIKQARINMKQEKIRFKKHFKDVEWEVFKLSNSETSSDKRSK